MSPIHIAIAKSFFLLSGHVAYCSHLSFPSHSSTLWGFHPPREPWSLTASLHFRLCLPHTVWGLCGLSLRGSHTSFQWILSHGKNHQILADLGWGEIITATFKGYFIIRCPSGGTTKISWPHPPMNHLHKLYKVEIESESLLVKIASVYQPPSLGQKCLPPRSPVLSFQCKAD